MVRDDKRRAILAGAFAVFARDGYAQACVRDIAAAAGVAKPTVYSHLTDKATLFRHAVAEAADAAARERLAALTPLAGPDGAPRTRALPWRAWAVSCCACTPTNARGRCGG
ncbi:TetR/AcrR family transcriptional regulator [Streptomyces radicis]|uniref:TetR/AcrR family transcriptional regulator n=1 Tax=Streptomyces radicis TaxID=1750517 RepID=UPI001E2F8505|nr:helix-turn-helix domain-containing protein [Streptomyces radicis]